MKIGFLVLITLMISNTKVLAQSDSTNKQVNKTEKKWYDSFSIKGYAQVRYNRLGETNPDLRCDQCDKSWGNNGGIFLRRARLVVSGQLHPRVYFYMQTDFANNVSSGSSTGQHFAQLRDFYLDLSLDKNNSFKFRIGQSKVPYGFDNLQSSQVRLSIDRSDAMNSGTFNERDMGVFFMYTPKPIIDLYKEISDQDLKGSGNYGLLSFGVYNGQTANKVELNNELHMAARITYPFRIKNQLAEISLMGYTGQYTMPKDLLSSGVITNTSATYTDKRSAVSLVLYPKPFGIQAEYTRGVGPTFDRADSTIKTLPLQGGYVTLCYKTKIFNQSFTPYTRYQYYEGGKKLEKDARNYLVREIEAGIEWQPYKYFEITAAYVFSNRQYQDLTTDYDEMGSLIRLQVQLNF
ncbi:MAG: porin [Crocinitomicaceae bacterium]|nr:porin [Crocinitomicaceae bacterium]